MSKNTGTSELINYFDLGVNGDVGIGGNLTLSTIANAVIDTDRFLVSDSGIIKYRTGTQLLSDIGAQASGNYVTTDTSQAITANKSFTVGFSLASEGSGNQTSFFRNTSSIFSGSGGSNIFGFNNSNNIYFGKGLNNGGVLQWNNTTLTRYYTLPDADGTIALVGGSGVGTVTSVGLSSATSGVTIGSTPVTTSGTITLAIATASGSQNGLLSSTDWTTFNNKQNALTNPVTGTGVSGRVAYWNGTNSITSDADLLFDGANLTVGGNILIGANQIIGINTADASDTGYLAICGASSDGPDRAGHIYLSGNERVTDAGSVVIAGGNTTTGTGATAAIVFRTLGTNKARLTSAGNFGIGTETPVTFGTRNLDVNGGAGSAYIVARGLNNTGTVEMAFDGDGYIGTKTAHNLVIRTNDIQRINVFATTGNVLIGTGSDAGFKLDVNGTGRFTNTLTPIILRGTHASTMWTEYYYNTSTLSGFVGNGSGLLSGANASDFIVRSEADFVVATGGNNRRLTIASTGAATFSSSVTATGDIRSNAIFRDYQGEALLQTNTSAVTQLGSSGASTPRTLAFLAGNTERMRITSGGNVVMGNNSGSAWSTSSTRTTLEIYGGPYPMALHNSLSVGNSISYNTYWDGTNWRYVGASSSAIYIQDSEGHKFFLNGSGSSGASFTPTERMRITSGGNVLIGTTTDSGSKLRVDGDVFINNSSNAQIGLNTTGALNSVGAYLYFNRSGSNKWTAGMGPYTGGNNYEIATGSMVALSLTVTTGTATFGSLGTGTVSATSGTLSTTSDLNYKIEDGYIDSAIEKVLSLKPRYFYWNEKSGLPTNIRQLGFYAQEVNEVLGEEAANTPKNENTPWGISDRSMIAYLTKAIQELKQEIDTLKN